MNGHADEHRTIGCNRLQKKCYQLFGSYRYRIIVLSPVTGAILSLCTCTGPSQVSPRLDTPWAHRGCHRALSTRGRMSPPPRRTLETSGSNTRSPGRRHTCKTCDSRQDRAASCHLAGRGSEGVIGLIRSDGYCMARPVALVQR